MENIMEIPQNIKNKATICPSNSTSGYLSKEIQYNDSKRYMHPYVYWSII